MSEEQLKAFLEKVLATPAFRKSSKQLLILMVLWRLQRKQDLRFLLKTWRTLNQNLLQQSWEARLVGSKRLRLRAAP